MINSQNGWPASADRRAIGVGHFEVAGVDFPGGVKSGDVAVVLGNVAREIHERVESLHDGWCWGHSYRPVTGGGSLSNHASGTAIDINAPRHPIGVPDTFTGKQQQTIRAIMRAHDDVVRWGGDYASRPDDMHFEINDSADRVATLARKIRNAQEGDDMTPRELLDAKFGHDSLTAFEPWKDKPGTVGHALRNLMQDTDALRVYTDTVEAELKALRAAASGMAAKLDAILKAVQS